MSTQPKTFLTPEQYLEIENKAECKSEFYAGEMFAMAGATQDHNFIAAQALMLIGQQIQGRCRVSGSDMRVWIPATGLYTYPDIVVICGPIQNDERDRNTLVNPTLIVEVLSPSTEAYDRGRKFEHYGTIPSLKQYVMISSDRIRVDLFTRQDSGGWLLTSAGSLDETVVLASIGCTMKLSTLYATSDLAAAPPA